VSPRSTVHSRPQNYNFKHLNAELKDKDKSIKNLVTYLFNKYLRDSLLIKDYWDADRCAIGLVDKSEKYLIYICTLGLAESRYFISLEDSPKDDPLKEYSLTYTPVGDFNDINLSELERRLVEHLRIKADQ
jgi:hypothetical protein